MKLFKHLFSQFNFATLQKKTLKTPLYFVEFILFSIISLVLFFFLGYNEVIFDGPKGMHFMRQTDSLSFISQYINNGYDFWNPQLFNLKNHNGYAACEFPILYYITALINGVVGNKVYTLKIFHVLITFMSIYFLYKTALKILNDYSYAILSTLFLFTSTVYCFYTVNFIPDIPALGFTIIGWHFYLNYRFSEKKKQLTFSFIFFTLASLIKVTYFINPLTIISFQIVLFFFKNRKKTPSQPIKSIFILGTISSILITSWNAYMIMYNMLNNSTSFNTKALPIWTLSTSQIIEIWNYITHFWYSRYLAHSSFHLLFIFILIQFIWIKKSSFSLLSIILFTGTLCYFILFYSQFKDHDYYALTFIPFIILSIINGINILQKLIPNKYFHNILKVVFSIIILSGINYTRLKLNERFNSPITEYEKTSVLIQKNLVDINNLHLSKKSKFIIIPDLCQNGGLFILNRSGWNIEKEELLTEELLQKLIKQNANYILTTSLDSKTISICKKYGKLILKKNELAIFKL